MSGSKDSSGGSRSAELVGVSSSSSRQSNGIRRSKSRHATVEGQRENASSLRESYEKKKALIPQLVRWNNLCFYTSMLGIMLTITDMELSRHYYQFQPDKMLVPLVLQSTMSVSTVLLLYFLIKYWNVKINIFKAKELLHKSATVWNTNKFRNILMLELFVSSLHVPPYVAVAIGNVYGNLHISSLGVVVFLRLYLVPRMLKQYFKRYFITHKVRLIGAINRVPFNTFFVNKAILNLRPYKLLLSIVFLYVLVSAYCLTQFEMNVPDCNAPGANEDHCHPSGIYFWRWVVFCFGLILGIEPATVPLTVLGQLCTIAGAMIGTCLVAILIAVVAESLTLSTTESRVVDQIRAQNLTKGRKRMAIVFIQNYWRWLVSISKRLPPGKSAKQAGLQHGGEGDGSIVLTRKDKRNREKLVVAMHEWRAAKRSGQMESQLTSISKDVSTVMDEVAHVKSQTRSTEQQVAALETKLDKQLSALEAHLDRLAKAMGVPGFQKAEVDLLLEETKSAVAM